MILALVLLRPVLSGNFSIFPSKTGRLTGLGLVVRLKIGFHRILRDLKVLVKDVDPFRCYFRLIRSVFRQIPELE